MASRWRKQEVKRVATWRQSLLFNSILLLLPIMASRMVIGAYTSDLATDPMGLEARAETRSEIDKAFREIYADGTNQRSVWAGRIEDSLKSRDFAAARGYLLAAPLMLNRQDAAAVNAAAEAEQDGTSDQRLARAALLFLPEGTRASYERAVAPPPIPEAGQTDPADTPGTSGNGEPVEEAVDVDDIPVGADTNAPVRLAVTEAAIRNDPFNETEAFFLLGDPSDLTRRTQRWLAGENINTIELKLRALGLIMYEKDTANTRDIAKAASILRGAVRARRLNDRFMRYMSERINDVLPDDRLRPVLEPVYAQITTTDQRTADVLAAFDRAIEPVALARLGRDMRIVAQIANLTNSSGAISLVELAETPEEMRRALLITQAGGDRSIALAKDMERDVFKLAQIGVQWSRALIFQVMALMALGMALVWTTLSTLTEAETVRSRRL